MHNYHVQVAHRFETPALTFPLSSRPTYLTIVLLYPHGCKKYLKVNMPKYELIPSAPDLVLFQGSIFQCRDPPFVQLSKLETQDSSLMPPPLLPTPFANLFSGSLGFYFCKSAHFYHPHLHCPGPFSWPPVCYAFIYPYFCVFYKHKVNLFTP